MKAFLASIAEFFRELKRRKVYQVSAIYVVLAVGGLEVLDLLIPATELPEWAGPFFISLAVVGLPLVAVFAWTFDLTPDGVVKTADREAKPPPDGAPAAMSDLPGADRPGEGEAAVVPEEAEAATPGDLNPMTVAVLPFDNLSGSEAAEPFAVGLHDDLLTELSRVSALTVISRTSVRAYRGTEKGIPEIGRELRAGTIVEAAVQTAGRRVRLNIQLIDARTDVQRWAKRYDRELTAETIFDLQMELATRIMAALEAELTSEERGRSNPRPTDNLDAYRLYVEGRSQVEQWSEEALNRAVDSFTQAIRLDPEYALAWAGLADAVSLLHWYRYPVPGDAPAPKESAKRALELDPELAEAHASRAIVLCSRDHQDAPGALRALRRATSLRPSYAHAFIWTAWIHLLMGEPEKALEPAERSAELDPLAPAARVFLAEAYLANGRGEEALREVVHGRTLQPEHALSHYMEGLVLYHLGRLDEAAKAVERALNLQGPNSATPTRDEARAVLAVVRAGSGDSEGARELLARIEAGGDACSAGLVYAALGETQRALEAFEKVENWGQLSIEHLRYFFPDILDSIRATPQYHELLRQADRSWKL